MPDEKYVSAYSGQEIDEAIRRVREVQTPVTYLLVFDGKNLTLAGSDNSESTVELPTGSVSSEQIDAWTDAAEKAHTHENKEILDATTASYTVEDKEKLAGLENGSGKYLPLSGGALYNGSTLMIPSDDTSYKLILSAESTSYRVPPLVDWDVGERYFANNGTARIGTIGAYGNGSTLYYYYLGTNYNSVCLKVTPDGVVSASKFVGANATQSEQGLMSAADKAKFDGIETGANKTTVDTSLSDTSTNPVQNKTVKTALDGKAASSHTHDYLPLEGNAASATKLQTARNINGVSFDGTKDISIPLINGWAYDDSETWANEKWHKIATTNITDGYQDKILNLYVDRGQSNGTKCGILRARIRAGSSARTVAAASLCWILACDAIDPSNFVLVCKPDSETNTTTVELWIQLSERYEGWQYWQIGSAYRTSTNASGWILLRTNNSERYASYTQGGTAYISTISSLQNPQSDTGWVSITLGSMFSSSSWLKCRKIGKTVHLQGELCPASAGIPGYTLMLSENLPYPPDTTRTLYPVNRAGKPMQIQLSAGAGITVLSPESGYTTDSSWIVDTTYFTEE